MAARTTPRATRTTAVGYLRRSTDRQEQSIPDQKKALERYAAEHGLRIVRFYTDDAISGTSTIGRRAFQQMMADAQGNGRRFDVIVVYDVKRFGRVDNDEAGYYRHVLRMHGVEVRYVSENFNGDGTDDLLRPVKQWQARDELQVRLEQLNGLSASQAELQAAVAETSNFLAGLEYTLREDVPENKRVALRQCVQRIWIDREGLKMRIALNVLSTASLGQSAGQEITLALPL